MPGADPVHETPALLEQLRETPAIISPARTSPPFWAACNLLDSAVLTLSVFALRYGWQMLTSRTGSITRLGTWLPGQLPSLAIPRVKPRGA